MLVYHIILTFNYSLTVLSAKDEMSHLETLLSPVVNVLLGVREMSFGTVVETYKQKVLISF